MRLSYALRFRLFHFSGHSIRATPAVFSAVIRGLPLRPTIQCSRAFLCHPFYNLLTSAMVPGYGSKNLTFSFFTVSFCSIQPKS